MSRLSHLSLLNRLTRRVGVAVAALGLSCVALSALAEVTEEPLTNPDDSSDVWGKKIIGLGDKGDETALVFTKTGVTMNWTLPDGVKKIWYLVVGGGGSGGSDATNGYSGTGGGGAGGFLEQQDFAIASPKLSVNIGAGGASVMSKNQTSPTSKNKGKTGGDSQLVIGEGDGVTTILAHGGGGGGYEKGLQGGSGGGSGGRAVSAGAAAYAGEGNAGGGCEAAGKSNALRGGSGGGGAGGAGSVASGKAGAMGGAGKISLIGAGQIALVKDESGNDYYCAGGGGGGAFSNGSAGAGGVGGGGAGTPGSSSAVAAGSGTNYGCGGGGTTANGWVEHRSGAGYQGIVVVRYRVMAANEVTVPTISGKTYNGELQKADIADGPGYYVAANAGGTDAGVYAVTLALSNDCVWVGGSTEPTNLTYTIAKAENAWTTEPSLSKQTWEFAATPATVTAGVAKSGDTAAVTYDDGEVEMPVSTGNHMAVFTVAEGKNYKAISKEIPYVVTLRTNSWIVEPSMTPATWTVGGEPGTANVGQSLSGGEITVTYDDGETGVPTEVGIHKAVFTVAEYDDYTTLVKEVPFVISAQPIKADVGLASVELSGYDGTVPLTNFPVLVRFSSDTLAGLNVDLVSEDGEDVRVYDQNGNELAFEIERWNRGGESLIWVRIPELVPVSERKTSVLVAWGKTAARTTEPKDVWTEYYAVYHLNDASAVRDSSGNGVDLYASNLSVVDGFVGKALAMPKGGSMADFAPALATNYAVSCWYRYTTSAQVHPLNKGTWGGTGWFFEYKTTLTEPNLIRKSSKYGLTTPDILENWNYLTVSSKGGVLEACVNGATTMRSGGTVEVDDKGLSVIGSNGSGRADELRVKKGAASAAWARADYRSQTGALAKTALVQNPVLGDVIVVLSAEAQPTVSNGRVLTIPYRVTSTGGSKVGVNALYAIEGDATTNTVVIGSAAEPHDADATGTVSDLRPGTNYVFAIFGTNQMGRASAVTPWQTVKVPGEPEVRDVVLTQTKDKVTLSGRIFGAETLKVVLRYAFDGGDLTEEVPLTLDANGAFSETLDRTSVRDVFRYQIAVTSSLVSPTWGTFAWDVVTPVKAASDSESVTYTWTGGSSGVWADPANWTANRTSCYGYPNSKTYATAKFTTAAVVDLEDGTYGLVVSGLVTGSNLGEVRLCNGAIDVPFSDFAYGASGTSVVFDNVTIKGQKGLKFAVNSPTVFTGDTDQEWIYEPWEKNGTELIVRDGLMTSGFFQSWITAERRHYVTVDNAVWTIRKCANGTQTIAYRTTLIDGADRQARIVVDDTMTLNYTWALAIPEGGHALPSVTAKECSSTDSCAFEVDVTDYKSAKKVPLVKFTGADQTETMTSKKLTLTAKARNKAGELVDVTAERNARLEWSAAYNTLYYKQDGQLGMVIILK